jgi:hypothetical protein
MKAAGTARLFAPAGCSLQGIAAPVREVDRREEKFNTRKEVQHQGLSSDFLPRMPRRPNQFRLSIALVVRSSSSTRCRGCDVTSSDGEGKGLGSSFGHSFASGWPRSRWRGRSAGLL